MPPPQCAREMIGQGTVRLHFGLGLRTNNPAASKPYPNPTALAFAKGLITSLQFLVQSGLLTIPLEAPCHVARRPQSQQDSRNAETGGRAVGHQTGAAWSFEA